MSSGSALFAVAVADFRERTRRYSFLLTLLFAVFLGYATATGKILLQVDEYRGVYTSGWIGTLVAMVITCFVSLVGFYIVKNAVERDRSTGVGQILAATPLSEVSYSLGKFCSNFAVLSSMVAVLAIAAVVMQFVAAEDPHVDLWALLSPFLLIALPAMALTSAMALLFEMVPFLRGGFGNIAWFFVWTFALSLPVLVGKHWLDAFGLFAVLDSLSAQALLHVPGYHGGLGFQIAAGQQIKIAQDLRWPGIHWTLPLIVTRLVWLTVAILLALLAALIFDRFDSFKAWRTVPAAGGAIVAPNPSIAAAQPLVQAMASVHLTPLASASRKNAFARLFVAELRLALQGYRWWWYAIALSLVVAQVAAPLDASRGPLLGVAWIWPALVWSAMGSRELKHGVRQLLFSCPGILPRQLFACWTAGLAVALLASSGLLLRLTLAHEWYSMSSLLAGAVFVPSLALALGVASGSSKFFEGLYAVLWYIGPMNHTPGMDYTGAADLAHPVAFTVRYLLLASGLLATAIVFRAHQLRGN